MKHQKTNLIDDLTADLTATRPVLARDGALLVAAAALGTVILVALFLGFWDGIASGRASGFFYITNGMLITLGGAAAWKVVRMANPEVGNSAGPMLWSTALLVVLPASAVLSLVTEGRLGTALTDGHGHACAAQGMLFGLLTVLALVLWLRRGAPVSLAAAGTLTGVAAGAIGSFAYGMACPIDTFGHLAIWHCLPVAVWALAGRVAVPALIKW